MTFFIKNVYKVVERWRWITETCLVYTDSPEVNSFSIRIGNSRELPSKYGVLIPLLFSQQMYSYVYEMEKTSPNLLNTWSLLQSGSFFPKVQISVTQSAYAGM